MTAERPNRFTTEDQFREFCERLVRKEDQEGLSFYPTKLCPQLEIQGRALQGGENVRMERSGDDSEIDRREAGPLLKDVQEARKQFPVLSGDYRSVLDKAEGVWKKLAQ
jgi:hypothetical protein